MIKKKEFDKVVDTAKGKLDETTSALVSEDLLAVKSAYSGLYDDYKTLQEENEKLKQEKEELLKVNGSLYQKIGFAKEEERVEDTILTKQEEDRLTPEDIIDKNGNFIV